MLVVRGCRGGGRAACVHAQRGRAVVVGGMTSAAREGSTPGLHLQPPQADGIPSDASRQIRCPAGGLVTAGTYHRRPCPRGTWRPRAEQNWPYLSPSGLLARLRPLGRAGIGLAGPGGGIAGRKRFVDLRFVPRPVGTLLGRTRSRAPAVRPAAAPPRPSARTARPSRRDRPRVAGWRRRALAHPQLACLVQASSRLMPHGGRYHQPSSTLPQPDHRRDR